MGWPIGHVSILISITWFGFVFTGIHTGGRRGHVDKCRCLFSGIPNVGTFAKCRVNFKKPWHFARVNILRCFHAYLLWRHFRLLVTSRFFTAIFLKTLKSPTLTQTKSMKVTFSYNKMFYNFLLRRTSRWRICKISKWEIGTLTNFQP